MGGGAVCAGRHPAAGCGLVIGGGQVAEAALQRTLGEAGKVR